MNQKRGCLTSQRKHFCQCGLTAIFSIRKERKGKERKGKERKGKERKGKEFCDVMVVFGNDVIIMSDKLINYNIEIDEKIAWNRWYKSAIESSIKQLNGAYNHINSYPDNLYTDAQATEPFSMELPHSDEICIHLIAIANGCSNACYRKYGRYGLNIDTACTGKDTLFTIGIPTRKFVHIFNDSSLDKIFTCLDTTRDFIDYIQARENLLTTSDKYIK
ncbi:TPA: hypothetical protein ACP2RK_005024, partial [Escherichia coli]